MHCPVPMNIFIASGEKQTLLVLSSSAPYWDKASTTTADVVLVNWIPPIPCSCEQLQTVSCCCFWSFSLLLHETGMMLARSPAAQPALTSSPRKRGTGDPFAPSQGQLCYSNAGQRWEVGTLLWVPPLKKCLSSALWELNSSKWKLRIWMCEQHLPEKAFDSSWVSQQEEFSSLELLPSSDQGTFNFCSAVQFLPPHSIFPLTALWLPRGLKPLWWWGIQIFSCLWLKIPQRALFSLLFWEQMSLSRAQQLWRKCD